MVILGTGARLFTNLSFARIGEIRTYCNAMLLEPPSETLQQDHPQLRGFGTEAAWPVFVLPLSTLNYEIKGYTDEAATFLNEAIGELSTGSAAKMIFESGAPTLQLTVETPKRGLYVDNVEGMEITEVWALLERRTMEFWYAPHMPYLSYCPPSMVAGERKAGRLRQLQLAG